jgi:hypothetical protein
MDFLPASSKLNSEDDKDIALLMYEYFRYLYEKSVETDIRSRAEKTAAEVANQHAMAEYVKEPWGGDCNPKLPYDEFSLTRLTEKCQLAKKQRGDAKSCLDFVVKHFI